MLSRGGRPAVSVIIPTLQERATIPALMATLEPFVGLHEIIFVDGGSDDGTFETLRERGVGEVLRSPRGRGVQLNHGAQHANGHVLMFLHADTDVGHEFPELALRAIDRGADGGCFSVKIRSRHRRLAVAGALQTARSHMFPTATGDQAIFVRASVFEQLGGFDAQLPICEDVDFVERFVALRGGERFRCLRQAVITSGRRWESSGITRTILLMWGLRAAYHLGVRPAKLSRFYRVVR